MHWLTMSFWKKDWNCLHALFQTCSRPNCSSTCRSLPWTKYRTGAWLWSKFFDIIFFFVKKVPYNLSNTCLSLGKCWDVEVIKGNFKRKMINWKIWTIYPGLKDYKKQPKKYFSSITIQHLKKVFLLLSFYLPTPFYT